MKKNKMMRLASSLLVAVLLTSSVISGTFAKYVTSDSAQDSARVAKFGVTVTATGDDAFAKMYEAGDSTLGKGVATDDSAVASVVSNVNVVAPGTHGTVATLTITGTPEVDVNVKTDVTFTLSDNWKDEADNYYCPLTIAINGVSYHGNNYANATEFANTLNAKFDEIYHHLNKTYEAGTNLASHIPAVNVTWEWAFEGNDDVKDTYLGDQAASDNLITFGFELESTVTQVD